MAFCHAFWHPEQIKKEDSMVTNFFHISYGFLILFSLSSPLNVFIVRKFLLCFFVRDGPSAASNNFFSLFIQANNFLTKQFYESFSQKILLCSSFGILIITWLIYQGKNDFWWLHLFSFVVFYFKEQCFQFCIFTEIPGHCTYTYLFSFWTKAKWQ